MIFINKTCIMLKEIKKWQKKEMHIFLWNTKNNKYTIIEYIYKKNPRL